MCREEDMCVWVSDVGEKDVDGREDLRSGRRVLSLLGGPSHVLILSRPVRQQLVPIRLGCM